MSETSDVAGLAARVDALEQRVAALEARAGVAGGSQPATTGAYGTADAAQQDPWSVAPWPQIVSLLRERKKIEAVKVYRGAFGVGLKEAKDAVEEVERRLY